MRLPSLRPSILSSLEAFSWTSRRCSQKRTRPPARRPFRDALVYSLADGFTDLLYGLVLHLLRRHCAFESMFRVEAEPSSRSPFRLNHQTLCLAEGISQWIRTTCEPLEGTRCSSISHTTVASSSSQVVSNLTVFVSSQVASRNKLRA